MLGGPGDGIGSCRECHSALISKAQVTVHNVRFMSPLELPGSLYILTADGGDVLVERSNFEAATAVVRLQKGVNSHVYSDDQSALLQNVNGVLVEFEDVDDVPAPPPEGERFLRSDDPWLTNLRLVCPAATRSNHQEKLENV